MTSIRTACLCLLALLSLVACGSSAARDAANASTDSQQVAPLTGTKLAVDIPQAGTSAERVRRMWKDTRKMVVKDAAATMGDEQYHAKRDSVFVAWTMFQEQLYQLNDPAAAQSQEVVPDILRVIDDLYGFGGDAQPRIESRESFKKAMDARLALIDDRVKALP